MKWPTSEQQLCNAVISTEHLRTALGETVRIAHRCGQFTPCPEHFTEPLRQFRMSWETRRWRKS